MVKAKTSWLEPIALRITRTHFAYVVFYGFALVIFDTWNLLTHDAAAERWLATGVLLVVTTLIWYAIRLPFLGKNRHFFLVWLLIIADILFASWNVYTQRGMASKAVALFIVPIVTAALLRSRSTLLAATSLSATSYALACIQYFYNHYGEGYRVELWGEVFFYAALFFVITWLLLVFITQPKE